MYQFDDCHGNTIHLFFQDYNDYIAHDVLVVTLARQGLVFMKHRKRGLELPGGKIEKNESPLAAAKRELYEETGGICEHLEWVGHYNIYNAEQQLLISKAIFLAYATEFEPIPSDSESMGVYFFKALPNLQTERFSFLVKDQLLPIIWNHLNLIEKLSAISNSQTH